MNRAQLLQSLKTYQANVVATEVELVQELIDLIATRPDCFEKKLGKNAKHIAAAAFLLTDDLSRALFMQHVKLKSWTQPGGHADGDENLHHVARRELEEETGVTHPPLVLEQPFDVYRFDFDESVFGYKKSLYNVWFAFTLPPGQTAAIMEPTKCTQLKWATVAEARELQRETSDIRNSTLIDKWEKLQSTLKG